MNYKYVIIGTLIGFKWRLIYGLLGEFQAAAVGKYL